MLRQYSFMFIPWFFPWLFILSCISVSSLCDHCPWTILSDLSFKAISFKMNYCSFWFSENMSLKDFSVQYRILDWWLYFRNWNMWYHCFLGPIVAIENSGPSLLAYYFGKGNMPLCLFCWGFFVVLFCTFSHLDALKLYCLVFRVFTTVCLGVVVLHMYFAGGFQNCFCLWADVFY